MSQEGDREPLPADIWIMKKKMTFIEGIPHKLSWEMDGINGGDWWAMEEGISGILEKNKNDGAKTHVTSLGPSLRRFYDLEMMTQCRQRLVDGNEWKLDSRLVKLRRIWREVQHQQAGVKVKSAMKVKKKSAMKVKKSAMKVKKSSAMKVKKSAMKGSKKSAMKVKKSSAMKVKKSAMKGSKKKLA